MLTGTWLENDPNFLLTVFDAGQEADWKGKEERTIRQRSMSITEPIRREKTAKLMSGLIPCLPAESKVR